MLCGFNNESEVYLVDLLSQHIYGVLPLRRLEIGRSVSLGIG